jgi:hypothetical protein
MSIDDRSRTVANDEWFTPAKYIAAARAVLGGIDLDPASNAIAQATVRAGRYYSKDDDGLAQPWHGRVWLNPVGRKNAIREASFVGWLETFRWDHDGRASVRSPRASLQRFADVEWEFPVPSNQFPVPPKIFPVRPRREFDQKGQ